MKTLIRRQLRIIILGFIIISVALNALLHVFWAQRENIADSRELFAQVNNVLRANAVEQSIADQYFKETCLLKANLAADHFMHNSVDINDVEAWRRYAKMLDVDELHIFNEKGVLFSGSEPKFFGMTFDDGEQIGFFRPMLKDKKLNLYQNITPNTYEKKPMQYSAVWMANGKYIVQVGMYPKRIFEMRKRNSLNRVFHNITVDDNTTLFAVDPITSVIVASTDDTIMGKFYTEIGFGEDDWKLTDGIKRVINAENCFIVFSKINIAGDVVLCRYVSLKNLYAEALRASLLVLLFLSVLGFIMQQLIINYLDKQVVNKLDLVGEKLNKIAKGNLDLRLHVDDVPEFATLSGNINQMVDNLLHTTDRMFDICDKLNLRVGLYEYHNEMRRVVATQNLAQILHFSEQEAKRLLADKERFEERLRQIRDNRVSQEENLYKLPWAESYIRMEYNEYDKGVIGFILDKTEEYLERLAIEQERDTDLMTGLYTRRKFTAAAEALLQNAEAVGEAALIFIDANNLKYINDSFGHKIGDLYLTKITDTLKQSEAPNKMGCRYGGDEFLLLLYGQQTRGELDRYIDKLGISLQNMAISVDGKAIPVSCSFGVAYCSEGGSCFNKLLNLADERMYANKQSYRLRGLTRQ